MIFSVAGRDTTYGLFHILWTKSTRERGADVVLTRMGGKACPLPALRHHLSGTAAVPRTAPLFGFETREGDWAPMFLDRVNEVWVAEGLEKLSGHCFHIGGTMELLLRGTYPDVVAMLGSWESRAFLKYWPKIEQILPVFVAQDSATVRVTAATRAMGDWQRRRGVRNEPDVNC